MILRTSTLLPLAAFPLVFTVCSPAGLNVPSSKDASNLTAAAAHARLDPKQVVVGVAPDRDQPGKVARLVSPVGRVVSWEPKDHSYRVALKSGVSYKSAVGALRHASQLLYVRPALRQLPEFASDRRMGDLGYVQRLYNQLSARSAAHERERDRGEGRDARANGAKMASHSKFGFADEEEDAGVDALGAYLYWLRQRAGPDGRVDWKAYDVAAKVRESMPAAPRSNFAQDGAAPQSIGVQSLTAGWSYIGPNNYSSWDGPNTGRIGCVTYDPKNPKTIYVGSAGGGVWKSIDGGINFTPLSDTWPRMMVSCIAVDPVNTNNIYVGTGDFDDLGGGFGIMKSTNGGLSFTNIAPGIGTVSSIVVDPGTTTNLTAAGGGTIWRSVNSGSSWTRALDGSGAPLSGHYWTHLAYSLPDFNGNRFLYAVALEDDRGHTFWRSTDRGVHWAPMPIRIDISDNPQTYFPIGIRLATSPTNKDAVYVITHTTNFQGGFKEYVLKSADAGISWTDITSGLDGTGATGADWSQGWYDIFVGVTSFVNGEKNPEDITFLGLIDLIMSPTEGYVWQSAGNVYNRAYPNLPSLIHPDQHAITFNPQKPLQGLLGDDGGLYQLDYVPGAQFPTFTPLNWNGNPLTSLGVIQFYSIAIDPTNTDWVLGGTQDNSSPCSFGDLLNYVEVSGGDGGYCSIQPRFPNYETSSSQSDNAPHLPIYRTTDRWQTATNITLDATGDNAGFIAPHVVDPYNPNIIYAASTYLYKFDDRLPAPKWSRRLGNIQPPPNGSNPGTRLAGGPINNPLDPNYVVCVEIAPNDSTRLYTGSTDGQLWMTTDAGASFTQLNQGSLGASLPFRYIASISINPTNQSDILVGSTAGMYRCSNTRAVPRTWVNVNGNLPLTANTIARDPFDPTNTIYAGTDVGVFMSTTGGTTWTNATNPLGLPNVQVNVLKTVYSTTDGHAFLYAGTYGRGMWRIHLAPKQFNVLSLTISPTKVFEGQSATATLKLTGPAPQGGVVINLSAVSNPLSPPAATLPATITVPEFQDTVTFPIPTNTIPANAVVTVTASNATSSKSATLNVVAAIPTALKIVPNPLCGEVPATATLTMNTSPAADLLVTLTSSDTTVATVPATVTVPATMKTVTFPVTVLDQAAKKTTTITASARGFAPSTVLTVNPWISRVALDSTSVYSGQGTALRIYFNFPVLPGSVLTLTAADPTVVQVPASVALKAGSTTWAVTVTGGSVPTTKTTTITATLKGSSAVASITVTPIFGTFTVNPTTIFAGTTTTGTVTLVVPSTHNEQVSLSTNDTSVLKVPASVTIPAGQTSANFTITGGDVPTTKSANAIATLRGATKTVKITVNPLLSGISVTGDNPFCAGGTSTVQIALAAPAPAGGQVVALSVSPTLAASIPASIVIPAGMTTGTATVTGKFVGKDTVIIVSASARNVTRTTTLTEAAIVPIDVVCFPNPVKGGLTTTGFVDLNCAATGSPDPTTVVVTSDNPAAIPTNAILDAGSDFGVFTISTLPVTTATTANITATFNGVTVTTTLVITAPGSPSDLSFNPNPVCANSFTLGTLTLNAPAPVGGKFISVTSNNPAVAHAQNSTVYFPAGFSSQTFTVVTGSVAGTNPVDVTLSAASNGATVGTDLQVNPCVIEGMAFQPFSMKSGFMARLTITLTCPAPKGGAVISLNSDDPAVVPSFSVTVPAGYLSYSFNIPTFGVPEEEFVDVTGTYNSSTGDAFLDLIP